MLLVCASQAMQVSGLSTECPPQRHTPPPRPQPPHSTAPVVLLQVKPNQSNPLGYVGEGERQRWCRDAYTCAVHASCSCFMALAAELYDDWLLVARPWGPTKGMCPFGDRTVWQSYCSGHVQRLKGVPSGGEWRVEGLRRQGNAGLRPLGYHLKSLRDHMCERKNDRATKAMGRSRAESHSPADWPSPKWGGPVECPGRQAKVKAGGAKYMRTVKRCRGRPPPHTPPRSRTATTSTAFVEPPLRPSVGLGPLGRRCRPHGPRAACHPHVDPHIKTVADLGSLSPPQHPLSAHGGRGGAGGGHRSWGATGAAVRSSTH